MSKYHTVATTMQCLYDSRIYKKKPTSLGERSRRFSSIPWAASSIPTHGNCLQTTICNIGDPNVMCISHQGQAGAVLCAIEHVP